jgi:acetyltransferase EpsM
MSKLLVIIGAGGHSLDVLDIAMNSLEDVAVIGFLDDVKKTEDTTLRLSVLGQIKDYPKVAKSYYDNWGYKIYYTIGINDSKIRYTIDQYMKDFGAEPLTLIHKSAIISSMSTVGLGSVIGHGAVITANAKVGIHTHMNTNSSINQGSVIGDYCTLSPGVTICGDVTVGNLTSLGANSTVINLKTIGDNAIIGAGAVVVNNIPSNVIAKGIPARYNG